jgi:hypothetical protein
MIAMQSQFNIKCKQDDINNCRVLLKKWGQYYIMAPFMKAAIHLTWWPPRNEAMVACVDRLALPADFMGCLCISGSTVVLTVVYPVHNRELIVSTCKLV